MSRSEREDAKAARARLEIEADPVEAARAIALRQLDERDRSRKELADVLRRRGIPDEAAAEVLDSLSRVQLIDDARFARLWVESRRRTRGLSRRALAGELARKGIGPEDAADALGEVDDESEQELAGRLAERKARTLSGVPADVAMRRVAGQLARKGYGAGTAFRAAAGAVQSVAGRSATSLSAEAEAGLQCAADDAVAVAD